MYSTSEFRKNLKIEIDGEPFVIIDCQHVKPGKGVAFVKTKYKSLISGRVLHENFRSGDKVAVPNLEARKMVYLYPEDSFFIFMDNSNYEQVRLSAEAIEEVAQFLMDNLEVEVLFHNGKPISIEMPIFLELEVTQTEPGFKGDTATGVTKPATLSTGAQIAVPLYVKEGDIVKVDTRSCSYVERVKN